MNLEVNNAPWSNEGVDVEQTLHLIEFGKKGLENHCEKKLYIYIFFRWQNNWKHDKVKVYFQTSKIWSNINS